MADESLPKSCYRGTITAVLTGPKARSQKIRKMMVFLLLLARFPKTVKVSDCLAVFLHPCFCEVVFLYPSML